MPHEIVRPDGSVRAGRRSTPLMRVNLDDAAVRHGLSFLRDLPVLGALERGYKRLRRKEWHYASVAFPQTFVAAVVFDAGYVSLGFAYTVDRRTGAKREFRALVPAGRGTQIAQSSMAGETSMEHGELGTIRFAWHQGERVMQLDVRDASGTLRADIVIDDAEHEPMVAVSEVAPQRWLYTHKAYGVPAGGWLELDGVRETAAMGEAHAGMDWNRGHRAHETFWNWAAAAGTAEDGRRVGWTLTAHAAHGERRPRDTAIDCAAWVDGGMTPLTGARFEYARDDLAGPWRVTDSEQQLDLTFTPLGERSEDVNYGVVVSRFRQPFGTFSGSLRAPDGSVVTFRDVFGVTEEHYARW